MIRYSLIVVLCILLGLSSYMLYEGKYIVVNIESGSKEVNNTIVEGVDSTPYTDAAERTHLPKVTLKPDISSEIEEFHDDSGVEIHLAPTVGVDINQDQQIASSYRIIGPRQFVLLTKDDESMVEIDLDTGEVKINPDYELDEVSTEFWNSIGKKYPEVCFVD